MLTRPFAEGLWLLSPNSLEAINRVWQTDCHRLIFSCWRKKLLKLIRSPPQDSLLLFPGDPSIHVCLLSSRTEPDQLHLWSSKTQRCLLGAASWRNYFLTSVSYRSRCVYPSPQWCVKKVVPPWRSSSGHGFYKETLRVRSHQPGLVRLNRTLEAFTPSGRCERRPRTPN